MYGNNYAPYKLENMFSGVSTPNAVIKNNSAAYWFWFRALYQRICSTIEFTLPENWNRARDFFEACLYSNGFLCVFNDKEFGTVFQNCQLSGYDFFYQPTRAIVTNPLMKTSREMKIGEDCSLIKLTNDFKGILDLCAYFSEKLATIDGAVNMNLVNSKFGYLIGAKNKMAARAIEQMFDRMNRGEPMVCYDKSIVEGLGDDEPFEFIDRASIKNSYVVSDLLSDAQTILNSFDTEIGIKSLSVVNKRERMNVDEVNAGNEDANARITLWRECLTNSIKDVNNMFGLDIKFKFKFADGEVDTGKEETDDERKLKEWVLQSSR